MHEAAGYDGPERRHTPQEPRALRWIESLGPVLAVVIGGAMAYGGLTARIDSMVEALADLKPLPVQVEKLRGDMAGQINAIAVEQSQQISNLAQRVSSVEQTARRNRENLDSLWNLARENQSQLRAR